VTDTEDRFDPVLFIQDTFMQLRKLYHNGHAQQIRDEIVAMTDCVLHADDGSDCLHWTKASGDCFVFDSEADVISEHLTVNGEELTDLASEAIVRRLANPRSYFEMPHFNSWLEALGFAPLKRER
jgi:hypothetical protein